MKVKCTEHFNFTYGFTFDENYEVINENYLDEFDFVVYNDYGYESYLKKSECEVVKD